MLVAGHINLGQQQVSVPLTRVHLDGFEQGCFALVRVLLREMDLRDQQPRVGCLGVLLRHLGRAAQCRRVLLVHQVQIHELLHGGQIIGREFQGPLESLAGLGPFVLLGQNGRGEVRHLRVFRKQRAHLPVNSQRPVRLFLHEIGAGEQQVGLRQLGLLFHQLRQ